MSNDVRSKDLKHQCVTRHLLNFPGVVALYKRMFGLSTELKIDGKSAAVKRFE